MSLLASRTANFANTWAGFEALGSRLALVADAVAVLASRTRRLISSSGLVFTARTGGSLSHTLVLDI